MSKLVKKCASCGQSNPETETLCSACSASLSGIRAQTSESAAPEPDAQPDGWTCPRCQVTGNSLPLCGSCGEIEPEGSPSRQGDMPASSGNRAAGARLLLVVGNKQFDCRENDILGREGTLAREAFEGIPTVSRHHLLLTCPGGHWYMTILPGVTNGTLLDGEEIHVNQPQPLTGEHSIGLSKRCEIRLKVC